MQDNGAAATGCAVGVVPVWESTGWGHGRTPCAQAAGQRLPMGGGHTHTAEGDSTRAGQPGLAGEAKCMIPSVGKSRPCCQQRHWVMDEEQAVAAVWSGAGSAGCQRLANYDTQECYDGKAEDPAVAHLAVKCLTQRHAQACLGEVLCRKGTHQRFVIPAPV